MKTTKLRDTDFKPHSDTLAKRIDNLDLGFLPYVQTFGKFYNHTHYLNSVDLLRNSSLEVEHQYEVFSTMVLPKIKKHNHMLDIGVGNGEVSKFFGIEFDNITAIDTNVDSLNLLPSHHWRSGTEIIKITGDIVDKIPSLNEKNEKYDLIVLSHILYYIPPSSRHTLVHNLTQLLTNDGIMVITYNDGDDRSSITNYFRGSSSSFDSFEIYADKRFKSGDHIVFQEKMHAHSLEAMLHIIGVCLCDANTSADRASLTTQITNNFFMRNDEYEVSMKTHVFIVGNDLGHNHD